MSIQRNTIMRATIIACAVLLMSGVSAAQPDIDIDTLDRLTDTINQASAADQNGIFGMLALFFVIQSVGGIFLIRSNSKTVNALTTSLQIFASANDHQAQKQEDTIGAIERQTNVIERDGRANRDHQVLIADTLAGVVTSNAAISEHLETLTGKIDTMAEDISKLNVLVQGHITDMSIKEAIDQLIGRLDTNKDEILQALTALKPPPNDTDPDSAPTPASKITSITDADGAKPNAAPNDDDEPKAKSA